MDGLHADGEGGFDVFGAVVEEEDVCGRGLEAFGGVEVDGGFGFGEVEGVGPGVVVEGFDPGVAGAEAGLHGVGHVGEDAGGDAGSLETLCPVEHGWVEGGPESTSAAMRAVSWAGVRTIRAPAAALFQKASAVRSPRS